MAIKGQEWTFDTVAEEYDKWRPTYVDDLYQDIFEYSGIASDCCALEIGIGTGQATRPILDKGCKVTAIELGEKLAKIAERNFIDYRNFTVVHSSFEEYNCPDNMFDLIYSASAFHWIDEKEGYNKVFRKLKEGGSFARFASHPFYNIEGQEELYERIQAVYFKYMPNSSGAVTPRKIKRYTEEDAERRSEIAKKYGFTEISTKVYYRDLIYSSEEYIKRLAIESDKIALDDTTRRKLLNGIKEAIEVYGGTIIVRDMIDLNLARK